jgi:hypothetical protein
MTSFIGIVILVRLDVAVLFHILDRKNNESYIPALKIGADFDLFFCPRVEREALPIAKGE